MSKAEKERLKAEEAERRAKEEEEARVRMEAEEKERRERERLEAEERARLEELVRTDCKIVLKPGFWKRKRKLLDVPVAHEFVGGIATNEITTFWWKRKRKRGSRSGGNGPKIDRFQNTG